MTKDEVNQEIDAYLKRVSKVLPDSFETDDLVEEIRIHIQESLQDKQAKNPEIDTLTLVKEVLGSLGQPEEIAQEWGKAQSFEEEEEGSESRILRAIMKQTVAVVAVIAAAWFVSSIPNSNVDFWTALIILMIFVIAEYFIRTWQRTEVSMIEADVERKR